MPRVRTSIPATPDFDDAIHALAGTPEQSNAIYDPPLDRIATAVRSLGQTPPPYPSIPLSAEYAPPNEAGVQGRARRQSHREGMGTHNSGGALLNPNPPLPAAPRSTVHPSLFTPLIPSDEQAEKLRVLQEGARQFANLIDQNISELDGKQMLFVRLRELMFWAREEVLRYGNGEPRPPAPAGWTQLPADPPGFDEAAARMGAVYRQLAAASTVAPSRQPPSARPGDQYVDPVTFETRTAQ